MGYPTFNGFSINDSNFIAERVTFKGFASRAVVRGNINRREGVKLLATEFGEKVVTVEGTIVASSASELQSLVDNMKYNLTAVEAPLIVEQGRTFTATVTDLAVPDEHYNLSKAPFQVSFICSNPYAEGTQQSVTIPVQSGQTTISGLINISGSYFVRPTVTYNPPSNTGNTLIKRLDINHIPTGQNITVSGFNSGATGGLQYQNSVTVNYDTFASLDGSSAINNTGAFSRWEPGNNSFTVTASGRAFPGGSITVTYSPRYL